MVILLPSAARIASGSLLIGRNQAKNLPCDQWRAAAFFMEVTAAATLAGDTLDLFMQHSLDGTSFDDFIHFTQVLGNGGAPKRVIAQWAVPAAAPTAPLHALADGTLAA